MSVGSLILRRKLPCLPVLQIVRLSEPFLLLSGGSPG